MDFASLPLQLCDGPKTLTNVDSFAILQYALLNELLPIRTTLERLVEAVSPHVLLQLLLLLLECWRSSRVWQDVLVDEGLTLWPLLQCFVEGIRSHISLQISLLLLKCWSGTGVGQDILLHE